MITKIILLKYKMYRFSREFLQDKTILSVVKFYYNINQYAIKGMFTRFTYKIINYPKYISSFVRVGFSPRVPLLLYTIFYI